VREVFGERVAWEGIVQVFELTGHETASTAYGWSYQNDDGRTTDVVVLGVPPITSPVDAVRAAIVAEIQRTQNQK
jgi:hypothetical protein